MTPHCSGGPSIPARPRPLPAPARAVFLALLTFTRCMIATQTPQLSVFPPFPDCRCLAAEEVADRVASSLRLLDPADPSSDTCLDTTLGLCLPKDFGSGSCRLWDLAFNPLCQTENSSKWCDMGWCYVDEATCRRPLEASLYLNATQPLFYSHAACGYVNLNAQRAAAWQTKNWPSNLRLTFLPFEDYRLFSGPQHSTSRQLHLGLYPDILFRSLDFLNYTGELQHVELTARSWEYAAQYFQNVSSDACLYMLSMNETDVCVGPFLNSDLRVLQASMMPPIEVEEYYLVVPSLQLSSIHLFLESFSNPFTPFTTGAWFGWLVTLCWVIVVFQWLEVAPRWTVTLTRSSRSPLASPSSDEALALAGWRGRAWNWLSCALVRLQLSAEALDILGERLFLPMTIAGKMVSVTLSLFLVLMVATYTANLAASLSEHLYTGEIRNLDDVIEAGRPVCIDGLVSVAVQSSYPNLEDDPVIRSPDVHLLPLLFNGTCAGAVMSRTTAEDFQIRQGCQVKIVGQALDSRPLSMMTRSELQDGFNLALASGNFRNDLSQISKQWKAAYYSLESTQILVADPSKCQELQRSAEHAAYTGLSLLDMSGVYGLVVLSTLVCLAIEIPRRLLQQRRDGHRGCSSSAPPFRVRKSENGRVELDRDHRVHVPLPPGFSSPPLLGKLLYPTGSASQ